MKQFVPTVKKESSEQNMELMNHKWNLFVNGDNAALGELYDEMFEPLVFKAYLKTGDIEVSRDIVAELFAQLIDTDIAMRYKKWKNIQFFEAYAQRSIHNKCVDHYRKHSRKESIDNRFFHLHEAEECFSIEDFSVNIPDKEKKLFQLHLDGFRHEELANQFNLTEKTIRNKLSITRKKIAASLKPFLTILL